MKLKPLKARQRLVLEYGYITWKLAIKEKSPAFKWKSCGWLPTPVVVTTTTTGVNTGNLFITIYEPQTV